MRRSDKQTVTKRAKSKAKIACEKGRGPVLVVLGKNVSSEI